LRNQGAFYLPKIIVKSGLTMFISHGMLIVLGGK